MEWSLDLPHFPHLFMPFLLLWGIFLSFLCNVIGVRVGGGRDTVLWRRVTYKFPSSCVNLGLRGFGNEKSGVDDSPCGAASACELCVRPCSSQNKLSVTFITDLSPKSSPSPSDAHSKPFIINSIHDILNINVKALSVTKCFGRKFLASLINWNKRVRVQATK